MPKPTDLAQAKRTLRNAFFSLVIIGAIVGITYIFYKYVAESEYFTAVILAPTAAFICYGFYIRFSYKTAQKRKLKELMQTNQRIDTFELVYLGGNPERPVKTAIVGLMGVDGEKIGFYSKYADLYFAIALSDIVSLAKETSKSLQNKNFSLAGVLTAAIKDRNTFLRLSVKGRSAGKTNTLLFRTEQAEWLAKFLAPKLSR